MLTCGPIPNVSGSQYQKPNGGAKANPGGPGASPGTKAPLPAERSILADQAGTIVPLSCSEPRPVVGAVVIGKAFLEKDPLLDLSVFNERIDYNPTQAQLTADFVKLAEALTNGKPDARELALDILVTLASQGNAAAGHAHEVLKSHQGPAEEVKARFEMIQRLEATTQGRIAPLESVSAKLDRAQSKERQPIAPAQDVDSSKLTEENVTVFLASHRVGDAMRSAPDYKSSLTAHVRSLTNPDSDLTLEQMLHGMTKEDANGLLEAADEAIREEINSCAQQEAKPHMEALLSALSVKVSGTIAADGHCLFHALRHAENLAKNPSGAVVGNNAADAQQMRKDLWVAFEGMNRVGRHVVLGNPLTTEGFSAALEGLRKRLAPDYAQDHVDSERWGGPEEIKLYAMTSGRPVVCVSDDGSATLYRDNGFDQIFRDGAALKHQLADIKALIIVNTGRHFESTVPLSASSQ
jgi:hypothetical protein